MGMNRLIATLTRDSTTPCKYNYKKEYDHAGFLPDDAGIKWLINQTTGFIQLKGCRDNGNGGDNFPDIRSLIKGPIYFTDASGNKTFGPEDESIDSVAQLKGKVVFRDPTFAGTFPGLTNDNIWYTMSSLKDVDSRTQRNCTDYTKPCVLILPDNPSDLDYLVYNLYWLNSIP